MSERGLLTLNWLLQQHKLDLVLVVPRTGVVDANVEFSSIQPTELVDSTEFISPHSIILTLGLSFSDEPEQWENYVRGLIDADVAAVGFGTGLHFDEIPSGLIAAAEKHRLCLFEVPRHTPFASIQNVVQAEFSRIELRESERLLSTGEDLNAAALKGGIPELLDHLSQFLEAAICLIDNDGRVVGAVARSGLEAEGFARRFLKAGSLSTAASNGEEHRLVHRLSTHGERSHFLVVVSPEPISAMRRSIIKHSAGLLDILIQRPLYLRSKQAELNTMALAILLGIDGSHTAMAPVFATVADAQEHVRPVVISAVQEAEIWRSLEAVNNKLEVSSRGLFALPLEDTTVAMLFRGTRSVSSIISQFEGASEGIRIAVGAPIAWRELSIEIFNDLHMRAKTVALGEYAGPATGVLRWTQDEHVRSLLDIRAKETYGRLRDFDAQGETELGRTLAAYLKNGGHVGQTATAMQVHRHTIRTRIKKISEVCEIDLDNPVTRAELLLVYVSRRSGS